MNGLLDGEAYKSSARNTFGFPTNEVDDVGFRLVSIPEPDSSILALLAGGSLLFRRKRPGVKGHGVQEA
jgi:hypothetical protein